MNYRQLSLCIAFATGLGFTISAFAGDTNGIPPTPQGHSVTADEYWRQGESNIRAHDWPSAISNLNQYVSLVPNDVKAYDYLSGVFFAQGDLNSAETYSDKALNLSPNDTQLLLNRGNIHRALEKYDAAIVDFTQCIQHGLTNAYIWRGATYAELGDYTNAVADYTLSLRYIEKPDGVDNADILLHRGMWCEKLGRFDDAIRDYRSAIQLNTTNTDAQNDLAWLLATCPSVKWRDYAESAELASNACRLSKGKRWEYIDTLSAAYAGMSNYNRAADLEFRALKATNVTVNSMQIIQSNISLYLQRADRGGQ